MDVKANNYNPDANISNHSCTYDVKGCTDKGASNYDEYANIDDGSCVYKKEDNNDNKDDKTKNDSSNKNNNEDDDLAVIDTIVGLGVIGSIAYGIDYYLKNKKVKK